MPEMKESPNELKSFYLFTIKQTKKLTNERTFV